MPLVDWLVTLIVTHGDWSAALLAFLVWELFCPAWWPWDTKLQKEVQRVEGEIMEVKELLISSITVVRAIVRTNREIDTEKVDRYLVENGVEPDDFIVPPMTDGGKDKE